jgi:hypothetical protein
LCYSGLMADDRDLLGEALRLGDVMSGRVADHSLRLRRLKRSVQTALHLLEIGRPQKAKDELQQAMLAEWKCETLNE